MFVLVRQSIRAVFIIDYLRLSSHATIKTPPVVNAGVWQRTTVAAFQENSRYFTLFNSDITLLSWFIECVLARCFEIKNPDL